MTEGDSQDGGQSSPARKRALTPVVLGILLLTVLGCFVLILDKKDEEVAVRHERTGEVKRKGSPTIKGACGAFCEARLQQRRSHHGGDYLSNEDLLTLVKDTRHTVIADLKVKYGEEYFSKMFESSKGKIRPAFVGTSAISMQRFQRKLQLKILEVQAAIHEENTKIRGGCNCNGDKESMPTTRRLQEQLVLPSVESFFADFVWATSGHSAAAGHGNLANESYTGYMSEVVEPVFASIGIEFEGRNYAMGGMRSAPLVSLCNEALFGTDVSVLSWDFGMTDARNFDLKAFFAQRAGVHRNKPVLVDMNLFGKMWKERIKELKVVEDAGLTTLHIAETANEDMVKDIPDMFGLTQEQLDAVPEYLRHMKCEGQFEKGNPTCGANKYNPLCPKRKHKAGWHPGWRVNAMYGYSIGLFLIESLVAAVESLGPTGYNPQAKLQQLKAEEDTDYEQFFQSAIPPSLKKTFTKELPDDFDSLPLFRSRAMCHTALLPSESRFKRYLEGNTTSGDFYPGVPRSKIDEIPAEGKLRIAFDEGDRQDWCPVALKIDHKDHFYANENDGWVSLTFPNDVEKRVYGPFDKSHGMVMICFVMCDWGKCPQGDREMKDVNEGDIQITINDVVVTQLSATVETDCGIAKSEDGWTFPRSDEGRYKVSVKVKENGERWLAYTRITAIVVV